MNQRSNSFWLSRQLSYKPIALNQRLFGLTRQSQTGSEGKSLLILSKYKKVSWVSNDVSL